MSKIMIVGAGKTGRGFVGRLLAEAGVQLTFVDKDIDLVKELNDKKSYLVSFFGNCRETFEISDYTATTWDNADFSDAELIFVSVCGSNLEDVGAELKKRLEPEKKYYIITCENSSKPAEKLKNTIGFENVFVSESTVFCTTIENGGIDINSENYPYMQFDAELLGGYVPDVTAIKPIEGFGNFLTRKLFTYNAASCIIAYMGKLYGYSDYGEAANDERILGFLDKNYAATNKVLCAEFGYDKKDQEEFALLSKKKFCDRTIKDTVARNAREPHRKLAGNERIIGPAKLLHQYGEDASTLEMTAAAAILYDDESDTVWREIKNEKTTEQILTDICGLDKGSELYKNILEYVRRFSS